MKEKAATDTEGLEGIDSHPRHDSWVRITTRANVNGFLFFLALTVLFIIVVTLHFNPVALAAVGVLVTLVVLWSIWRNITSHRQSLLDSVGLSVRIKAELLTELGAKGVHVDSAKGVVTLRGSVPYADFREAAGHLAQRQGARQVINELTVVPSASGRPGPYLQGFAGVTTSEGAPEVPTHRSLEERVQEALEADPRVHGHLVIVRIEEGMAYLTGRQETVQASEAATEIALHVPGILGVSNDIEVMPSV